MKRVFAPLYEDCRQHRLSRLVSVSEDLFVIKTSFREFMVVYLCGSWKRSTAPSTGKRERRRSADFIRLDSLISLDSKILMKIGSSSTSSFIFFDL